jgi:glycosyltransferase involved in cell wall biosynthesis
MIKILHVCHEPLPSPHTNTEQTVMTAVALADDGARVHLLCPVPSHRAPSGWEQISEFYGVSGDSDGRFRLIELPVPRLWRGSTLKPWLDIAAARHGRRTGYDFHLVRDPLALAAALAAGCRTVFESYRFDLNSDARYGPWRAFCYRHRHLAGFITHSEMARQSLLKSGVSPDRTLVAHNGHDPSLLEPRLSKDEARRRLGLPQDRRIVVYAGRVGKDKGTDGILPLARELPGVEFLVVGHIPGSGAARRLARRVSAFRLNNVRLVERVPPASVAPYLYAADCLLIPPSTAPLQKHKRTVLPMKVFRYMAAGRPILGPRTPDVAEVLSDGRNALLVHAEDVSAAAQGLQRLLGDDALQRGLAHNALADSYNHSWARRAQRIIEFLRNRL